MSTLEEEIGELLRSQRMTIGTVESATGGLISHRITNVPGSSEYYLGSIISYSNEIKARLVGVKQESLNRYGAVSPQVAREMAKGGRKLLGVDICIADTGIAGPGGATPGKPVGLFYLGLSHQSGTYSRKHIFQGNRLENKEQAAELALFWLKQYLLRLNKNIPYLKTREVVTCFLQSENKILLLRRSERVGSYQGRWAGVSGYIETNPDEQAFKEIKEETGLEKEDISLIRKSPPIEVIDQELHTRWRVFPYLFRIKNPDKINIDWEHKDIKWITPEEIDQYQTVPKLKEALLSVLNP